MSYLRYIIIALLLLSNPAKAEMMGKNLREAQFYFLIDIDTGEILLSKNADTRIAPSSMTKLMTAYVVFDQIQKGRINFDSQCIIGKDAWHKSGTTMFLNYGDVVSIDQLLKGLLVVSGNDAAVALAESSAGGINNFVELMNLKAKELGLSNSHFRNPHGLNDKGHYMSIRDLATLATHLYQDFPQYSYYFGIPEFTYRNITQRNRNPLIRENYDGIVGGKTGYTGDGGYGITAMVKRNHRRLIAVVNKAKTPKQRAHIVTDLLDYGFLNYKKIILFGKNQTIASLPTWLGSRSKIDAITNQEIAINIPSDRPIDALRVNVKYKNPLYAPIKRNAKIADLVIEIKDYKTFTYPLYAKEKIDKAARPRRILQIARYKIRNFYNKIFN
jgi:D-alanyl-D-alanine carboxypeptidase (penicillin-binding protein 5/6)